MVQQTDDTASSGLGNAATAPVGKRSLCPWRVHFCVHGMNNMAGAGLKWHFNLQCLVLQRQCLSFDRFYILCTKIVEGS